MKSRPLQSYPSLPVALPLDYFLKKSRFRNMYSIVKTHVVESSTFTMFFYVNYIMANAVNKPVSIIGFA